MSDVGAISYVSARVPYRRLARAIGRVFARLGEKKNRNKARLKFVVAKLGIEEFKRIVMEERATMPEKAMGSPAESPLPSSAGRSITT